jgi:hypothetical protein
MIARAATAVFLAVAASGVSAQSAGMQTAERFVAQCVKETHARGSYQIVADAAIPQVIGGNGATARGERNVNDCLADKYQLQPGGVRAAAVPVPQEAGRAGSLDCAEILSRRPGTAAAYSFGSSVLLGAVGASIQAGVYQRNLQTCLARGGAAGLPGGRRTYVGGCTPGSLMAGGTRYCNG